MPHEPGATEKCREEHCCIHNEDEPFDQDFMACGECMHVYKTEQELVDTFNATGQQMAEEAKANGWDAGDWIPVDDSDQIFFCPLCSHDF